MCAGLSQKEYNHYLSKLTDDAQVFINDFQTWNLDQQHSITVVELSKNHATIVCSKSKIGQKAHWYQGNIDHHLRSLIVKKPTQARALALLIQHHKEQNK